MLNIAKYKNVKMLNVAKYKNDNTVAELKSDHYSYILLIILIFHHFSDSIIHT